MLLIYPTFELEDVSKDLWQITVFWWFNYNVYFIYKFDSPTTEYTDTNRYTFNELMGGDTSARLHSIL